MRPAQFAELLDLLREKGIDLPENVTYPINLAERLYDALSDTKRLKEEVPTESEGFQMSTLSGGHQRYILDRARRASKPAALKPKVDDDVARRAAWASQAGRSY